MEMFLKVRFSSVATNQGRDGDLDFDSAEKDPESSLQAAGRMKGVLSLEYSGISVGILYSKTKLMTGWQEVKFSAEEEDSNAIVGKRAKASGIGFDLLNPTVESFCDGVGDRVEEVV